MKEAWLRFWIGYYRASTYGTLMYLIALIAIVAGGGLVGWSMYEAEKKDPGHVSRFFKELRKIED